ncbi:MAG: type II toxin-antitoxin system HicB family antitoxin [Candidatus Jacksonbacteria bacterium]|nr:type II toxin-antitoxin system HicB family antitoxin [Candidatus Jacksonbacteria bacterium]
MLTTEYKIEYDFDQETGAVTAVVPALNYLSSFGATFAETEKNITEAIGAYLEALTKEESVIPREIEYDHGTFVKVRLRLPQFA